MARKNRVSVYDGIYHITSRIANRAMLLAEDEVKDSAAKIDAREIFKAVCGKDVPTEVRFL